MKNKRIFAVRHAFSTSRSQALFLSRFRKRDDYAEKEEKRNLQNPESPGFYHQE
jgi:hypothetical protein